MTSIKQINPDRLVAATAAQPPLEEVAFAFGTIRWTYVEGGVSHKDTMR